MPRIRGGQTLVERDHPVGGAHVVHVGVEHREGGYGERQNDHDHSRGDDPPATRPVAALYRDLSRPARPRAPASPR